MLDGVQVAAIKIVMSDIDSFVSSTGNFNFFTLDQMKKLDNNAVVGMSVNLQRDRLCLLAQRPWKAESRQHQASKDRFVLPLGHSVIVLVSGPQNGVCLLPKELGNKVVKLHLPKLAAKLTVLTQEHAHEAKVENPFQGLHYPLLGCKFQSMVLSLAVVAVLC